MALAVNDNDLVNHTQLANAFHLIKHNSIAFYLGVSFSKHSHFGLILPNVGGGKEGEKIFLRRYKVLPIRHTDW
jgi:hypothetical protein